MQSISAGGIERTEIRIEIGVESSAQRSNFARELGSADIEATKQRAIVTQSPYEAALVRRVTGNARLVVELHGDWRTAPRLYGSPIVVSAESGEPSPNCQ